MFDENFPYKYCPILSISPSEITGLKELPEKDKDLILPIFPIKSWATSKKLTDAIAKVESAIGKNRKWIADIDHEELLNRSLDKFRDVHKEIKRLTIPDNGYKYWCDFIVENPNTIPCLQLKVLTELQTQIKVLSSLNRGIVIILRRSDIESQAYMEILTQLRQTDNLLILLDLEQITNEQVGLHEQIKLYLIAIKQILPNALVSLSSTSFPDSFGGYYKGTKNIYERRLYEILKADVDDLIYSDRGGARATNLSGGGGTPPPRIDYACRNEWNFIRMELESTSGNSDEELRLAAKSKKRSYTLKFQKKL